MSDHVTHGIQGDHLAHRQPQFPRKPYQSSLFRLEQNRMGESDLEFPQPSTIASLALKVYGRAKQCVINIPACENLSQLLYGLVDVLQLYSDHGLMADNQNAQHMMYEMQEQLEMAMRGIERVSMMPSMYRSINALRITTEFRNFCHSLGLTLEGLHSLLSKCPEPEAKTLSEGMKRWEWAFRTAQFPLEERDLTLYKEMRRICSMSYGGEVSARDGLVQAHMALENAFGTQKLQDNWKRVSKHLFQDLDAARIRRDLVEQHSIRLLLCALSQTIKAPPEFICPLTMEVMEDPVVLFETGVTVERRSLEMWLYAHGSRFCPVSGKQLHDIRFAENKAIRALIDDWRCENAAHEQNSPMLVQNSAKSLLLPPQSWAEAGGTCNGNDSPCCGDPGSDESESNRRNPWVPEDDWDGIFSGAEDGDDSESNGGPLGSSLLRFKDSALNMAKEQASDVTSASQKENGAVEEKVYATPRDDYSSIAETMLVAESTITDMSRILGRRRVSSWRIQKEIFLACGDGDLETVVEAFESGASLDAKDDSGWTCMHWGAAKGHAGIVQYLIDNFSSGINIHEEEDRATPLYLAAFCGHVDVANLFIQNGADVLLPNRYGWTPLHAAADQGNVEVCKAILDYGDSKGIECFFVPTEVGWTALHHACRNGHLNTAVELAQHMPDVNRRCNEGWTALHVAVDNCKIDIVEMLLSTSSANPNMQSKSKSPDSEAGGGWTPLHAAQDKNQIDIGKLLIKFGADPDIQGDDGATALHRACFMGNTEFAMMLVAEGNANLNKKMHKSGRKAIQIASDSNHTELYNYLYWQGLQRRLKIKLSSFKII